MILAHDDIIKAEKEGSIAIKNRGEVGATSIDVRIERLYLVKPKTNVLTPETADMPYEQFKEEYLVEVPLVDNSFWVLTPNQSYMAESIEDIFLSKEFSAEITTRSSWGRYGVFVKHIEDDMQSLGKTFDGKIPFMITSYGPSVLLRPGDAPGQITFSYQLKFPLMDKYLKQIVENEGIILKRDEKILKTKDLEFNNGITLTLDNHIKVYTGGVIDPRKPVDDMFVDIEIPEKGFTIHRDQFFISSSAETVKIAPDFLGWVKESNYFNPNNCIGSTKPEGITTYKTHPNAPKIDPYPVFDGKITFENKALCDLQLRSEQRITELILYHLNTPYNPEKKHKSRYKGQKKATSSKGHIKHNPQQLELDFK